MVHRKRGREDIVPTKLLCLLVGVDQGQQFLQLLKVSLFQHSICFIDNEISEKQEIIP